MGADRRGAARMVPVGQDRHRLHRSGLALAEPLRGVLQRPPARRAAEHQAHLPGRGEGARRGLAPGLHRQPSCGVHKEGSGARPGHAEPPRGAFLSEPAFREPPTPHLVCSPAGHLPTTIHPTDLGRGAKRLCTAAMSLHCGSLDGFASRGILRASTQVGHPAVATVDPSNRSRRPGQRYRRGVRQRRRGKSRPRWNVALGSGFPGIESPGPALTRRARRPARARRAAMPRRRRVRRADQRAPRGSRCRARA